MSKIYLEIRSGLGNQLFQYAFGYSISREFNKELVLCPTYFDKYWKFVLKKILGKEVRSFRLPFFIQNKIRLASRTEADQIQNNPDITTIREEEYDNASMRSVFLSKNDFYLKGYWQNPDLFSAHFNDLVVQIAPSFRLSEKCMELLSRMNDRMVGIHVRRGDFLTNKSFGACALEYYTQAMQYLSSKVRSPQFIIFTNDKSWVLKNFPPAFSWTIYSNDNDKYTDIEELYLLSKFQSLILSNSTFSWWGGYLSFRNDRHIVCPMSWFLKKEMQDESTKLINSDWKQIKNKLELF